MKKIMVPEKKDYSADAVVIGGGMVGVATAYYLSKAGMDTICLEMRDGLATLTSSASIEAFRLQFTEPAMFELCSQSLGVLLNFQESLGLDEIDLSVHQQGYLFMTDDEAKLPALDSAMQQYAKLGVDGVERLNQAEIQARFPYVSPQVKGATFRKQDGWLSFHEAVMGFVKAGRARYFVQTRVQDLIIEGGAIKGVVTDRGTINCGLVVNAAGPFAGKIGRMAGLDLPLEPVRRQKAFIKTGHAPKDAPFVVDIDENCYWRPEAGGALLGCVDEDEPVTEPMENPHGDWDFAAIVLDLVSRLTPFWLDVAEGLKKSDVNISAGQYVYTPDDQPLIGPVDEVGGLYLNCGYWAGMMLSAGSGMRIADLATGKMLNRENPLRPTRFAEGVATTGGSFLR